MADPPGATATSGGPGKRKISETGTATNGVGAVGDAPAAGAIGMASATGTAAGPIPTLTPPPFDFLERARTLVANLMGVEGYTMEEAHGNECKFLVTIKTYKRILKPSIPNLKAEVRRRYELYKTARLPTSTSKPPIASLSRLYAVRIHLQELSPLPITSKEDLQEMKAQLDAIRRVIANEDAGEETTFEEACVKVWAATVCCCSRSWTKTRGAGVGGGTATDAAPNSATILAAARTAVVRADADTTRTTPAARTATAGTIVSSATTETEATERGQETES